MSSSLVTRAITALQQDQGQIPNGVRVLVAVSASMPAGGIDWDGKRREEWNRGVCTALG